MTLHGRATAEHDELLTLDKAMISLLFCGGLNRSVASNLQWRDVTFLDNGDCRLEIRFSKTNQSGSKADYRLLVGDYATAIRDLRNEFGEVEPNAKVMGLSAQSINLRIKRLGEEEKLEGLTAHIGRIALAVELTGKGAETHEIMLAGSWRTERMVAHYASAGKVEQSATNLLR